ncbi:MAG: DNA polymerase/3'-5' exonuclease PolX [Planctomycetales bacterium]|nr:DNA polymerase/3'-5' exonuclease PolX [Planctomycetales bacterium]
MNNADIAHVFEEMADLLELRGENAFRVRAYRNGAKAILDLSEQVADILADKTQDLKSLPGIGATLVDKCQILVATGKLPQLEKLKEETPPVLLKMTRIPGLGAKKAMALQQALQLESLEQLRQACLDGRVRHLKGFAAKTEQIILAGLEIAEAASRRLRIDQADHLVNRLQAHLAAIESIEQLEFAGSYRRGKETVGDVDILVVSQQPMQVMDRLEGFPARVSTIARGDTKMSIRVDDQFQVDLRVVPRESFGAALQYFTGSKEHNVAVRSRARKMGLTLNEYGVARIDSPAEYIAGATEEEVYGTLGLQWIAPELREGRHEIEWAESDGEPPLIQACDIVADLHMHTTASDGENSIAEMVEAARARGLKYIAITDHSKRVSMARGLDESRLLAQWAEIDQFNQQRDDGFRVLKGIECDILEAGPMDLADEVLAQADWVIGSVHYGQKQSKQQITDRILGALCNPHVDLIAHPTGRLIGARPAYEVDLEAVFQCAVEQRKFLELNAAPKRLDLCEQHLQAAARLNIPICINTDAHSVEGMNVLHYGIVQARRAGLEKSNIVNTWSLDQLLQWLRH